VKEDIVETASLRSYLEPTGAKFYLRFSLISQDASILEKSLVPFLVIDESDPLARLIEAELVTDAGSQVKRVFTVLQKDEYLVSADALWPFNNQDVDQCWQKAFSFYSDKAPDQPVVVLSDQIRKDGGLSPFQSLFLCKAKQVFFGPRCPVCGSPLHQCYDDDLLTDLGLQPYTSSLKRYLFCPSCFDLVGKSDFYVFALENSDPPMLKDRWELIREFGQLTEDKNHVDQFPCALCAQHEECYGSDGLCVSKIIPVSFYPFYMLIFDAMSVSAPEFLSLISGASFEEVEGYLGSRQALGSVHCLKALRRNDLVKTPFFFRKSEKYFLEVLYLKLSFLGELVQTISSGLETYTYPDLGLSLDRIWVKLADQGGLLPFLWNFKVKLIDIGGDSQKRPFLPKLPPFYGLHFLGLVWFYTLLANKRQSVSEVYVALGEAIEKISSNDYAALEGLPEDGLGGAGLPENIFWDPEGKIVDTGSRELWERSLGLGWSLLNDSLSGNSDWSKQAFLKRLENLRDEIKDNLFTLAPTADGKAEAAFQPGDAAEQRDSAVYNKAIHDILVRIRDKWHAGLVGQEDALEKTPLEQTVVLSTAAAGAEGIDKAVEVSPDQEETLETVILSPGQFEQQISPPEQMNQTSQTGEIEEDGVLETVVISPSDRTARSSGSSAPLPPKDVGLEASKAPLGKEPKTPERLKGTVSEPEEEDSLAQTVVLSPDKLKDKGKGND
jgi:hypothetical protein